MIEKPDEVSNRTKHINISYHWIREAAAAQILKPEYIPTEENIADLFTKPLYTPRHQKLCAMLGMGPQTDAR